MTIPFEITIETRSISFVGKGRAREEGREWRYVIMIMSEAYLQRGTCSLLL